MKFQKVVVHNFLSWREEQTFNLEDQGLVYLLGPNGSGKSSIFDAVCWALYGRTTKNLSADGVVNNKSKKDCQVELHFQIGKKSYVITRYRKHSEFKNEVKLQVNGRELETSNASIGSLISDLLGGCDYLRMIQTIFFAQGDRRYFTQLSESSQREVLRDYFNFSLFKDAQGKAKLELREVLHDVSEASADYELHKEFCKDSKSRISKLKLNLKNAETSAQINVEALRTRLSEGRVGEAKALERISDIREELEQRSKRAGEVASLSDSISDIGLEIIRARKDKVCSKCGSRLKGKSSKAVIDELVNTRRGLQKELKEVEVALESSDSFVKLEKEEIGERKFLKRQRSIVADCTAQLKVAKHNTKELKKNLKEERDKLTTRKSLRAKAKIELDKLRRKAQYLEFWEGGFGNKGVELFALNRFLPIFNRRINELLAQLPTKKGPLYVNYRVNDKNHLVSDIKYEGSGNYAGASGGEKRRIDLCVSLALHSLAPTTSNILLLDEPFEGIESSMYVDVTRMLMDLDIDSVFVSSHSNELRAHFPTIWQIDIDKKGSSEFIGVSRGSKEIL